MEYYSPSKQRWKIDVTQCFEEVFSQMRGVNIAAEIKGFYAGLWIKSLLSPLSLWSVTGRKSRITRVQWMERSRDNWCQVSSPCRSQGDELMRRAASSCRVQRVEGPGQSGGWAELGEGFLVVGLHLAASALGQEPAKAYGPAFPFSLTALFSF